MLVSTVDVEQIGPEETEVGFSAVNASVHNFTGVNMLLYNITDWLGIVPFCVAIGFAILGLVQLIKRKSIKRVDSSIIILGIFYVVVIVFYLFFEIVVINYRPLLIEGKLEESYPSSTTMLTSCVMPTSIMQLHERLKSKRVKAIVTAIISLFTTFMILTRVFSGVHWITDIIGGLLISISLVAAYSYLTHIKRNIKSRNAQ